MGVTLTGAEYTAFFEDKTVWPDESDWIEGELVYVDGRECEGLPDKVPDGAVVRIDAGIIRRFESDENDCLVSAIRKWKRQRNVVTIVVEVRRDAEANMLAVIKAAGGKIVT